MARVPVKTLKELVAYAKANPGKLSYGSAGVGTSAHLCAELFKQLAGLPDIVHVPYKGANPGLADFFSGHLPMFAASISPQVLRHAPAAARSACWWPATAASSKARPTFRSASEVGFPELVTVQFIGVFAPGATPQPVIDKLAGVSHRDHGRQGVQQKLIAGRASSR